MIYEYRGGRFPDYLKTGNACQFIAPAAQNFCKGSGLDVGAGKWPLPGAKPIDLTNGGDAMNLPAGQYDFVFSSHCLEHLANPVAAIEHWKTRLMPGGVLFLYLPHPEMSYWLPQNNRKHLHAWQPREMARLLGDLGFVNVIRTDGYDSYWSFMVVGFMPTQEANKAKPDASFRELMSKVYPEIHKDAQLAAIYDEFGADAFRRSSAVEKEFETIIKATGFRGKRCVEIGSFNGITAHVLARYFDEVVSFDIFHDTLKHAVLKFTGVKNIRFIDIKDNAEKAKIIAGLEFDGAYVDGDHECDAGSDFLAVRRCGRVLFHEYWQTQPAVWNLVNALRGSGEVRTEGKFALWTAAESVANG